MMTQAKGFNAQLLVDFESAFGQTPATPHAVKLPVNSSQIKSKQNMITSNMITGRRDPSQPAQGNVDVSGTVVVPVDDLAMGYWLKAMFGVPVTSGASAPYTHVFKPAAVQPSLVLEQGFSDINVYNLFNGCKASKFLLTLGGDTELTASIDVMGAKESVNTASFATAPANLSLNRFNQFQASVQEGGSNIAIVTKADLTVDFGLNGDNYAVGGHGCRSDISEGMMQISGNLTAFFEDASLLNKALNSTETSLRLGLSNGDHSLEFYLPQVVYERSTPGIEGSKGVLITLPYHAFYNGNSENAALKATLINGQATY